jgi:transglutaminase-like putative cysteine protease
MQEIIAGKNTDFEKAEAIFYYSLDEWEWVNYSNTSRGAVKTIQQKGGNCCDLSHAVVAMARAAGLPARYRHAQCKYKKSGKVIGHVMAEIYVDGKWYLCDPSSSGTTFGNHEAWSVMSTFNGLYDELPF